MSVSGQSAADPAMIAAASMLGGTYKCTASCIECDSTLVKLTLLSDSRKAGGTYSLLKTNIYDGAEKKLVYRSTGDWHLLKNNVPGDNTTIIVVDINYGDEVETYPLFMVRKDGNLLELNQQNIERYPRYLYKDTANHQVYIAREGGKPMLFKKTLHYKDVEKGFVDPTVDHIFKKQ